MTPQQQHEALAALARGRTPPLPPRPSRTALNALLRSASRIPPGPPSAALSRAVRLLGNRVRHLPNPILLDAATKAALHFAGKQPVAHDPGCDWLPILLPPERSTAGSSRTSPTLSALAASPAPWSGKLPLPSQALVAVNPRTVPDSIRNADHELHLSLCLRCPNGSVAIWRRSARITPVRRELPSLAALAATLRSTLSDPDRIQQTDTAPTAASRAASAFRELSVVSSRALPQAQRVDGTWAPWQASFEFIHGPNANDPDAEPVAPHAHPTPLAIPTSLLDIRLPTPKPFRIPRCILDTDALSDAQLEAYALASNALSRLIPHGPGNNSNAPTRRRGFLLADSTGTGKGRVIAALIANHWSTGHRRALWISSSPQLIADARRDWNDINGDPALIHPYSSSKDLPEEAILFTTYAILRSRTNTIKLRQWLAESGSHGALPAPFIAFDECQATASLTSRQAASARILQRRLPRAHVLYASATATREILSWTFADRLALWDSPETCFASPLILIQRMHPFRLAGLELIFRHLAAHGTAITRSLSMRDVHCEPLTVKLTAKQRKIHAAWASAWRIAYSAYRSAMRHSLPETTSHIPADAITALRQSFFRHLITSYKAEALIANIEHQLANGRQCVVQLESTLEAQASRSLNKHLEEEGHDAESGESVLLPPNFDLSPATDMLRAVREAFPTHKLEPAGMDGNNKPIFRPAKAADGSTITCPLAVMNRERAIRALSRNVPPMPLLDRLVLHFGDRIAELTGRSARPERIDTDAYGRNLTIRPRSSAHCLRECQDFQSGQRRILVFSNAGTTGRSFHDDLRNPISAQRVHYIAEPSWDPLNLLQGIGRTHRSAQRTAPVLRLAATDLPGEARYLANASSRISRISSSNRANSRATTAINFEDLPQFDNAIGRHALAELYADIRNRQVPDWSANSFTRRTGLPAGTHNHYHRNTIAFLNRLLTLHPDHQDQLWTSYMKQYDICRRMAELTGELDRGITDCPHRIHHVGVPISYGRNNLLTPIQASLRPSSAMQSYSFEDSLQHFQKFLASYTKSGHPHSNCWYTKGSNPAIAIQLPEHPAANRPAILFLSASGMFLLRPSSRGANGSPAIAEPGSRKALPLKSCKLGSAELLDTCERIRIHFGRHGNTVDLLTYHPCFLLTGDLLVSWTSITARYTGGRMRPICCTVTMPGNNRQTGLLLTPTQLLDLQLNPPGEHPARLAANLPVKAFRIPPPPHTPRRPAHRTPTPVASRSTPAHVPLAASSQGATP